MAKGQGRCHRDQEVPVRAGLDDFAQAEISDFPRVDGGHGKRLEAAVQALRD